MKKGLRFGDICSRPSEVLALTSLSMETFLALVPHFEAVFQSHMNLWCMDGKPRKLRRYSTYRSCPLPTAEDRLLFLLVYLKTNALQVAHGRMFGMVQCKANFWIHLLLPMLGSALEALGHTPCRTLAELAQRLNVTLNEAEQIIEPSEQSPIQEVVSQITAPESPLTVEEAEQMVDSKEPVQATAQTEENVPPPTCVEDPEQRRDEADTPAPPSPHAEGPVFCHDGLERRIQRPQDSEEQILNYSGKKKTHTVKNLLLVDESLTVIFLSDTVAGKMHDKKLADTTPYPLPPDSRLLQDLGFQGFSLPNVQTIMPFKKPRGGQLTSEQKEVNRQISSRRVRIEHVNSSVKRCRVIKDTLRLLKKGIRDFLIEICCALHNFRVSLAPWKEMA